MATPLSPAPSTALNFSTPPTSHRNDKYEVRTYTTHSTIEAPESEEGDSSPFMSQVKDDQENPSVARARPGSRILSGTELSPLKILQDRQQQQQHQQQQQQEQQQTSPAGNNIRTSSIIMPPPSTPRSPRKLFSPDKRFPIKVNAAYTPASFSASTSTSVSEATPRASEATSHASEATPRASEATPRASRPSHERQMSLEDVMRENEGLKHAIGIFEDEASVLESGDGDPIADAEDNTIGNDAHDERPYDDERAYDDEHAGADDTMMSTFSTFSAVPNLTMLAHMRSNSPTKLSNFGGTTPRAKADPTPSRTPRAGPLPNRSAQYDYSGNTTSLMDFTEQFRTGTYQPQPQSPSRRGNAASHSNVAATPQRSSMVNLLDFDIPPLPTPRSIPTITPRELESLKSGFLSEISSLKASLSGKEAEVSSLKSAVGDAEKRVGECLEQLRESSGEREALAAEREGWERRGREMEAVLRKVKGEIVLGHREREELEAKLDEADKRREAAEMMAQEAESKMAGMRAGKASAEAAAAAGGSSTPDRIRSPGAAGGSNREVEIAVERVARELHALYKGKHETKVAALKKSYENRWEKKVRELEARVEELARENEELRLGRDATMTRVDPARLMELEGELKADRARDAAQIRELEAEVEKLEAVAGTVRRDNADLRRMLEKERVEKGELVILAEEMMSIQQQQSFAASTNAAAAAAAAAPAAADADDDDCDVAIAAATAANASTRRPARTSLSSSSSTSSGARVPPSPARSAAGGGGEGGSFRNSMSGRPSGLRAPGGIPSGLGRAAGESRIGRMAQHERTRSSGSGTGGGSARPGSGMGVRSGIMSSIEKMGSYRRGE